MKFNEKLIEIRKKQGLSQEELGMGEYETFSVK